MLRVATFSISGLEDGYWPVVITMAAVRDGDVAAALAMLVIVLGMGIAGHTA